MATLPNPNPIPNQGLLEYSYSVDPSLPDITSSILSNTVFSQVNVADLEMTKSSSSDYVKSGDEITYIMVITNTGNIDAESVVFRDTVPAGFDYVNGTFMVNGAPVVGDPNLGVTLANITPNEVVTVEFNVIINTIPTTNPIENEAIVEYLYVYDPSTPNSEVDGVISNKDSVDVNEAVIDSATGGIVKTADKEYVTKDEVVTYTIVIKNNGNTDANNVIVNDTIPAETSFVSGSVDINGVNQPSEDINAGINLGTVTPNEVVTIEFEVVVDTVPDPNILQNDAVVDFTFTTDPSVPDGESGGGISTPVTIAVNYASLDDGGTGFIKVADVTEATIGDEITYTLVVTNTGNTDANNVVITDTIPNGTTFVNSSVFVNGLNRPSDNPETGINIGTITPNEVVTIEFKVLVDQIPVPNPTENQAIADYTYTKDPAVPDGESVTDVSTIVQTQINYASIDSGDGGLVKTSDVEYVDVGDEVVYTIVLTNTGNVDAENVVVYDTIPAETSLLPGSVTVNGTPSGDDPLTGINVGTIAPNEVVTVEFTVVVDTLPANNTLENSADAGYTFPVEGVDRPYRNTSEEDTVNVVYVDLSVNKVADKAYADLGEEITYTVTVTNVGNTQSENAFLTDTVPEGTSFVSGSVMVDGVADPVADPTVGMELGVMLPGQVKTVTFRVLVESIPATNPVTNVAGVDFDYIVDPNDPPKSGTGGGTSGGTEIKNARFDEAEGGFTKVASVDYATLGDTITYTLVLENLGNVDAENVVVVDTVPENTNFVAGTVMVNGAPTGENPNTGINLGTVAPGEVVTITFDVIVVSTLPTDVVANTGSVTYDYEVDPGEPNVEGSDESNETTSQINVAIIDGTTGGITKTSDKNYVTKDEVITYTVSLTNTGNVTAVNAILKDTIPAETSFVPDSFKINGVTQPGVDITNPLGVGIGNIASGETKIIEFQVIVDTVPDPNVLSNEAVVEFVYTTDPSIPNGETGGGISEPVDVYVNYGSFDKDEGGFSKVADVNEATLGDIVTYTLVLTNIGNVTVNNVVFSDTIPNGTSFVDASVVVDGISKPTEHPENGINIGSIGAGDSVNIIFKVLVESVPENNPIENEGRVDYTYTVDPADPNGVSGVDLSSIAQTQINYASIDDADGGFTKVADKENVDLGEDVRFTLVLKNTGNVDAENVVLQDTLPSEVSYVPGTLTVNGIINGGDIESGLVIGTIAPNEVVTVAFTVTVNSVPDGDVLSNVAGVDYSYVVDGEDINVTNDSSESEVNVINGEVTASKASDKDFADVGEEITYTIVVENIGNVEAQSVYLQDVVPEGTSFVTNSLQVDGVDVPGADPVTGYNIGNIPVGENRVITFKVIVDEIPTTNPVKNTATIDFSYLIDPNEPLGTGNVTTESNETEVKNANFDKDSGGFSKSADKLFATIGEEIEYTITLTNLGNVDAINAIVIDDIPENVEFVEGSATINGLATSGNPEFGIPVGDIGPGTTITLVFKVIVVSLEPTSDILNEARIVYEYIVDPTAPPVEGEDTSNQILSEVRYADIELTKIADTNTAFLNNTVEYTIQVANNGNVEATDVLVIDTLADGVEFVPNSLLLDGVVQPGADITAGFVISSVMPGESKVVKFKAKFVSVPRGGVFKNVAAANYEFIVDPNEPPVSGERESNSSDMIVSLYISPDKEIDNPDVFCPLTISNGQLVSLNSVSPGGKSSCGPIKYSVEGICTPSEKVCVGETIREYKMWKQVTVLAGLDLESGDIEEIDSIKADLRYIRTERISTPSTDGEPNLEGELLTGEKEIVEGVLHFTIRIVTSEGDIIKKEFDKLFSSFVVINEEYLGIPLNAKGCVEDIEITSLCNGIITVTSTILTYLVPGDDSCGIECLEDNSQMQCISNSKLCPNINEFLGEMDNLWKEFDVYSNLYYEEYNIGELLQIKGDVKVIDYKIINTPLSINMNNESLNLTGKKMLVNMILTIKLNYISGSDRGIVKRKNVEIPVGTYVVLTGNESICDYSNYTIKACIEDVFACNVDCKYVFTNTTLIVKVIPCEPRECRW